MYKEPNDTTDDFDNMGEALEAADRGQIASNVIH